jgi:hypothetical protein
MIKIIKTIDGKESELGCSTLADAEMMVKSNPKKYSFPKDFKKESVIIEDVKEEEIPDLIDEE